MVFENWVKYEGGPKISPGLVRLHEMPGREPRVGKERATEAFLKELRGYAERYKSHKYHDAIIHYADEAELALFSGKLDKVAIESEHALSLLHKIEANISRVQK